MLDLCRDILTMGQRVSLHLPSSELESLFRSCGPSLGLWRAAEIAALRLAPYPRPVLDLGCGDGLVTSYVLSKVEIGVDPDAAALARAGETGIYRSLLSASGDTMAIPDASVATVISNSVLEHVSDLGAVLSEVARVLRPGGGRLLTSPTPAFSRQWFCRSRGMPPIATSSLAT